MYVFLIFYKENWIHKCHACYFCLDIVLIGLQNRVVFSLNNDESSVTEYEEVYCISRNTPSLLFHLNYPRVYCSAALDNFNLITLSLVKLFIFYLLFHLLVQLTNHQLKIFILL